MARIKQPKILENVEVTGFAALGKAIAKPEGKALFISGAIPGDVVDVLVYKNKKDWAEGRVLQIKKTSPDRIKPVCKHFGICGGCQWQMLSYDKQLTYKEQEVRDTFHKAGIDVSVLSIIGSDKDYRYRNKLEFTFSDREFLPRERFEAGEVAHAALGYHMPGHFDKILNITECHLMDEVNDRIRNGIRDFALGKGYSFYNVNTHEGWLRNMMIRYSTLKQCMVNIVVAYEDVDAQEEIKKFLLAQNAEITTLLFTINPKLNDSIYDLEPKSVFGEGFIYEQLGRLKFKISPKSFFQTNTLQAVKLYDVAKDFAHLHGDEIVYDLYCGTGSIGMYLADAAQKIIGVEVIEDAVNDAKENAQINNVKNAEFFAGDVIKICDDEFFKNHGHPDVVVVDPPRAGMHGNLITKLLEIKPKRIVYVSCNIGTQARDLNLLKELYDIKRLQPVDMFPQTYHIECVAELNLK